MNLKTSTAFSIVCIAFGLSSSEKFSAREIAEMEESFARMSRETNTVKAFMDFLGDDAIMFRNGEAVDGKSLWVNRQPDGTLLNWWPIVAEIAKSGDLGYTTGPYQFFNKRTDSAPEGNGYYSTVWKRQKDGKLKIKVDLGVRLDSIQNLPDELKLVVPSKAQGNVVAASIGTADANYNAHLNSIKKSFDVKSLSKRCRIHRAVVGPVTETYTRVAEVEKDIDFSFEQLAGESSASGEFGYAYGNVNRHERGKISKANYLRVWKFAAGEWRIVLDVITE